MKHRTFTDAPLVLAGKRQSHTEASLSLTPENERERGLIARAQAGENVRDDIVLSLQRKITAIALRCVRYTQHLEVADLVGTANVAILQRMDQALTRAYPHAYGYLLCIARSAMIDSIRQHGDLIKTWPQKRITVFSLDASIDQYGDTFADSLSAEILLPSPPSKEDTQYAALYQAIHMLPEKQQSLIQRHYGLNGAPETLKDICRSFASYEPSMARNGSYHHTNALKKLRQALAPILLQETDGGVQ